MSLRPLIVAAAAALVIPGAVLAAPAASGGSIDAESDSAVDASPEDLAIKYVRQHPEKLGVSAPTASEHLRILTAAGLLRSTRIKKWTFYRRNEPRIREVKRLFRSAW